MTPKPDQGLVIYVAGPTASYGEPKRLRALEQIHALADPHGITVFAPEAFWKTRAERRREWSKLCPLIGEVVIVANADDTIDAVTKREVSDALGRGVPVSSWTPNYMVPWDVCELLPCSKISTRRAARIQIAAGRFT